MVKQKGSDLSNVRGLKDDKFVLALAKSSLQADVASQIKALRKDAGWDQLELSMKSGLSLPLIKRLERGKADLKVEDLLRIAECTNTRLHIDFV